MVQGYLNVPHGASLSNPQPLLPGQTRKIEPDRLPTAYVFQPGHRLRLALAGGSRRGRGRTGRLLLDGAAGCRARGELGLADRSLLRISP